MDGRKLFFIMSGKHRDDTRHGFGVMDIGTKLMLKKIEYTITGMHISRLHKSICSESKHKLTNGRHMDTQ